MAIREVAEAIIKYDDYIITSHINAEGDAIGSELALYYLIKQLGKNAVVINNDVVPDRYRFLPGWDKVTTGGERPDEFGNVIVVDCPTMERSGKVAPLIANSKVKINIDHHISNNKFADFNWVEPEASSCGEMVFNLYRHMGLNINEEIAVLLYIAILTDTGSFRYDATTTETHRIAGELIKMGVHPAKMAEKIYETRTLADIGLLSKVLSTLTVLDSGRISYIHATKRMFEETNTSPEMTDGFINFARSIKGSEISIFFREDTVEAGTIRIGFRSKGKVNVNVLAGKFGGGGHPKASGCSIKGELKDVISKVLKVSEEFLV